MWARKGVTPYNNQLKVSSPEGENKSTHGVHVHVCAGCLFDSRFLVVLLASDNLKF